MNYCVFTCFLLCVFNGIIAQEDTSLYDSSKRISLYNIDGNHVENKKYHLIERQGDLIIADFHEIRDRGKIEFFILNENLTIKTTFQIEFDAKIRMKLDRYSLSQICFNEDELYLFYSEFLVTVSLNNKLESIHQSITEFNFSYDRMFILADEILLLKHKTHHNPKSIDKGTILSEFIGGEDIIIHDFEVGNYFMWPFAGKNPLIVLSDSVIIFLLPGLPEFKYYYFRSDTTVSHVSNKSWYSPSISEKGRYNRLAKRNPYKLFSEINQRLLGELSYNMRIDQFNDDYFGITYMPGGDEDINSRFMMDVWNIESGIPVKVKTVMVRSNEKEYTDSKGILNFGFYDSNRNSFCYLNGKRYQLNVEPKADWSDSNAERIKEERNVSLLNNQFELCLYIGTLDLD